MTPKILPQFEFSENVLLARAPAKINLSLLIGDKRADGYHNLETIMAKIAFYDELRFEMTENEKLEFSCDGLWSPDGKENLVYKTAELFYKTIDKKPSAKIKLTKNIPAGSGLGGASSDAATTLLALNKLHNEILNEGIIYELSAKLGSDVSFFLNGPLALCTGRGEKVEKIDKKPDFNAILVLPDINISTKRVYEAFEEDMASFNSFRLQIREYIREGKIDIIQKMCVNMLAKTCFALDNRLALLQVKIKEITRLPVCLSGSGSALFVVYDGKDCRDIECFRREIDSLGCYNIIIISNEW
ncbi:MAG: 4-(cytidine 5'-diphospho)-2-C-methyl-D-erythritol kinase [Planctomycetes bacterium GWF2_41_51]|nr:MAG: 4-(cytidine 5'-diphospho)-2-C-methyl-D-erythritol kinase [Planctomycetes bacterium GWF2_41_51]HBG28741.1 4-(cytidine 5'-diphospho)-2-C-methyl-D-erythritol kinase [Phycisphaerales bacterium]